MSEFPQYRKYKNESSWFRIRDAEHFEEIKRIGDHYYYFRFDAKILPDRNFIQDLLYHYHESCLVPEAEEFERLLALSTPSST